MPEVTHDLHMKDAELKTLLPVHKLKQVPDDSTGVTTGRWRLSRLRFLISAAFSLRRGTTADPDSRRRPRPGPPELEPACARARQACGGTRIYACCARARVGPESTTRGPHASRSGLRRGPIHTDPHRRRPRPGPPELEPGEPSDLGDIPGQGRARPAGPTQAEPACGGDRSRSRTADGPA